MFGRLESKVSLQAFDVPDYPFSLPVPHGVIDYLFNMRSIRKAQTKYFTEQQKYHERIWVFLRRLEANEYFDQVCVYFEKGFIKVYMYKGKWDDRKGIMRRYVAYDFTNDKIDFEQEITEAEDQMRNYIKGTDLVKRMYKAAGALDLLEK